MAFIRTPGEQRHGIKYCRLVIRRILAVNLFHRLGVLAIPRFVIPVVIAIEDGECVHVVALALRLRVQGLRLLDKRPALLHLGIGRTVCQRVVQPHRLRPIDHRAGGVLLAGLLELFLGFVKPERVQKGDAALDRFLLARRTGNRKRNRSQLLPGLHVLVSFVRPKTAPTGQGESDSNRQQALLHLHHTSQLLSGRAHHRRVGFATECLLETAGRFDSGPITRYFPIGMRIRLHHDSLFFDADGVSAPLSPGDEELLFRRKPSMSAGRGLPSSDFS